MTAKLHIRNNVLNTYSSEIYMTHFLQLIDLKLALQILFESKIVNEFGE